MENFSITKEMIELCCIYHKRNLLGKQRDTLRHKYRYLQDIKRSLQVRDNYKGSDLYKYARGVSTEYDKQNRQEYLTKNPIPKRFKWHSLSDINMMLLEAEAEVCKIKLKVMKHTKKYDKRIKQLIQPHLFKPVYSCGLVKSLGFYTDADEWFYITDMKRYHDEYLAGKAIDKMLEE